MKEISTEELNELKKQEKQTIISVASMTLSEINEKGLFEVKEVEQYQHA